MNVTANRFSTIAKCAKVSPGFPFRGAVDALDPGPIAVIQMRNVDENGVDWPSLDRVSLPTKRKPDLLAEGDVIFTTRGRRNFALELNDICHPAVCSTHFFVLRAKQPEDLLPAFLAWQINQKPAQAYFQQTATGSHILNITRSAMEELPVAIPPVEVQHEIVALADAVRCELSLITALMENRQRQLDAVATQILTRKGSPND